MRIKWSINNNGGHKNAMTKLIQHISQQFLLSNLNDRRSSRQMLRHQQVITHNKLSTQMQMTKFQNQSWQHQSSFCKWLNINIKETKVDKLTID